MEILRSLLFIVQFGGAVGLHVDDFIPFGEDSGDTIFFSSDDNTTSIAVPLRFPFFNRYYSTIHVSVFMVSECQRTVGIVFLGSPRVR